MSNKYDKFIPSSEKEESGTQASVDLDKAKESLEVKEKESSLDRRRRIKSRLSAVRSRGMVVSQLDVEDLPKDMHGEWVPKSEVEINRMRAMGFEIDDKYAIKNGMHTDGTGKPIIGDVIYMTCEKENKDLLNEIDRERYVSTHGTTQEQDKLSLELRQYEESLAKQGGVPKINETKTERVAYTGELDSKEYVTARKNS